MISPVFVISCLPKMLTGILPKNLFQTIVYYAQVQLNSNLIHSVTVQGCQIFLYTIHQNKGKYTKLLQHYQMAIKYTKWP
jgi:hypothetical protein